MNSVDWVLVGDQPKPGLRVLYDGAGCQGKNDQEIFKWQHSTAGRRHAQGVSLGSTSPGSQRDPVLIKALRAAHAMLGADHAGLPVFKAAPASSYPRRLVRLAFLAPDLQRTILAGR